MVLNCVLAATGSMMQYLQPSLWEGWPSRDGTSIGAGLARFALSCLQTEEHKGDTRRVRRVVLGRRTQQQDQPEVDSLPAAQH